MTFIFEFIGALGLIIFFFSKLEKFFERLHKNRPIILAPLLVVTALTLAIPMCVWITWNLSPCSFHRDTTEGCVAAKAEYRQREQEAIDGLLKQQAIQAEWDRQQLAKHKQNIEEMK